ncbi:glycosyltransferase family 10 domain-containing protein [Zunongwangia profunda]|jgi:hypothetical protein|uniref:glycosyltransferase family 10 domain-containing protein n=2 Tax=Zunongwangia profunda TaxID=398743 RepID=UPI00248EE96B|nr:glycosyltransferase family 10 [Zunongwangia profunda]|tara:strand:- start:12017 stop:12970 length:954 start_codon:yes stop_codon:yes gene_type:complete
MIKVYKLDSLKYTPFDENFILNDYLYLSERLKFVEHPKDAKIIITSSEKHIFRNPSLLLRNKKFLIWTNEPRVSTKQKSFRLFNLFSKIHVMNVYTKSVFVNQVTYQKKRFKSNSPLSLEVNYKKDKQCVALMSFYNGGRNSKLIVNSNNVDLIKLRSEIALYGYKYGFLDIYGKGWPQGISKEDSRNNNWVERKKEILGKYRFNLCFENTIAENYITEKIWDSIENYCLPIYFGGMGHSIYKIFPKNGFIDYAEFKTPKELFDYIAQISEVEYNERLQKCIAVYNSFIAKPESFWIDTKKQQLDKIIETCENMMSN